MGRRKKQPALSTDPRFWVEWIRVSKQVAPEDPVVFGWLAGTMTVEELLAIRVAADKFGAEIKINRKGAGEVVLPSKSEKEEV